MGLLGWVAIGLGVVVLVVIVQGIYLSTVLQWEDEKTRGLGYYGLPPAERERFKRSLRLHARLLLPLLRLNAKLAKFDFRKVSFQYQGVSAPRGSCSAESFARATEYRPGREDIFVVTQMKCGTTWMQHVVYEVLLRGGGDLVASGRTLYGVCPWIEGLRSVPMAQAPIHGAERPSRIVKTHLPVQLCPSSAEARYIYVARHPVSCFASCIDFITTNVGGMAPAIGAFEEWFCSKDMMWWGTWTDHVRGWWEQSTREKNVLFLFFEDMKKDLPGVVRQVAEFLGVAPLTEGELAQVVTKCGFAYMQLHQGNFEMQPPHILQADAELFVRGTADRHKDVPAEVQRRLLAWSEEGLKSSDFPLSQKYADGAAAHQA